MSRVYFHSPSDEAELCGSERAYAGCLCSDLFVAVTRLNDTWTESPLRYLTPESHYSSRYTNGEFNRSLALVLTTGGSEEMFSMNGEPLETFSLILNTALAMGNDSIKLLARIHGQSELHGYVLGKNRTWLAGIITQGLVTGVLRKEQGWGDVAQLLLSRSDEPVVMSYSVCDSFPNAHVADWKPLLDENDEKVYDAWYDLPEAEQWALAMKGIEGQRGLEIKPDNWNDFVFTHGVNGFQLLEYAYAQMNEKSESALGNPLRV